MRERGSRRPDDRRSRGWEEPESPAIMTSASESLDPHERDFTPAEQRLLRAKARDLRQRAAGGPKAVALGAAVIAALWLATLVASDAPWPVVTLFWTVVGGGIVAWVWRDIRRDLGHASSWARRMETAAARGRARVWDIVSTRYAEFEEYEDEGACWAFDLGSGRIVFVTGQEFYPAPGFPSLDFSLVDAVDDNSQVVDSWIEKRGEAVAPDRVIPREVKLRLDIPEHLAVIRGDLDDLEEALTSGSHEERPPGATSGEP